MRSWIAWVQFRGGIPHWIGNIRADDKEAAKRLIEEYFESGSGLRVLKIAQGSLQQQITGKVTEYTGDDQVV